MESYASHLNRILFTRRGTASDVCSICLGSARRNVFVTPCGHYFHTHCLRRHVFRSRTCPNCRSMLPLLPGQGDKEKDEEEEGEEEEGRGRDVLRVEEMAALVALWIESELGL